VDLFLFKLVLEGAADRVELLIFIDSQLVILDCLKRTLTAKQTSPSTDRSSCISDYGDLALLRDHRHRYLMR
jgi:hypothetical protein